MRTRGLEPPRAKGPPGPKPGAYSSSATSARSKRRANMRNESSRAVAEDSRLAIDGGHERPSRLRGLAAEPAEGPSEVHEGHRLLRAARLSWAFAHHHSRGLDAA